MPLSFRQLEIVRAVCRQGSVTAAAAALDISQPAVSMMLRESAAVTGFPLFQRRQGRLQPTAELRLILRDLDQVFDGMERIGRLMEDMRDASIGTLQLAATPTLADNLLPRALALFRRSRPRVQISIQAMDNTGVVGQVLQERVDLGLVLSPVGEPDVRLVDLCTRPLVCILPPDNPLARRRTVALGELGPYPLISFSRSLPLGNLVERCFRAAGVARRIAIEVNQSSVACAMVRAGLGIAIIDPFFLMDGQDHGVAQLALAPAADVSAQALLPGNATPSRLTLMFLANLRRAAATAPWQALD
ncbi:LysR family transcriptional regulator [Roseomonas hellenica]|uniref:LysR family transcriptional regulator n=1 Tax=Plastoroseomonas hellenica TaxID=2687306 RepID=A0ABS5F4F6_9PROT|nr:LysR family transcriptional regulator [Plastoroseomonas hellenica]MBR0667417.1 LysR family transcriptional regulator [Plastoroseomonas hellenica]